MVSCNKSDIIPPNQEGSYAPFLEKTTQTFSGKLDGSFLSWTFGWKQSQGMAGYQNGNGICDSTDPVRIVSFGLTWESDLQTRFVIYSPRYNSDSEVEFSQVFSVGKKKLGEFGDDFNLVIYKDYKVYQTNKINAANEIEILKTEEFEDNVGKKLRVWFKLVAKLSSCNCQNNDNVLTEGFMIAEFYGIRKGS